MERDAVSEVMGALFLIAIAVTVMIGVVLVFTTGPLPQKVPSFHGIATYSSNYIHIFHEGGDALNRSRYNVLVDAGSGPEDRTNCFVGPDPFTLGKNLSCPSTTMPKRVVLLYNSSWGGNTVLLAVDFKTPSSPTPPTWYSRDWFYRKKITIDRTKVAGTLSNFPVLINLPSDWDLANDAQEDGDDIVFTSWNGIEKLSHEIEYFSDTTGALVAWVKVPSLSSSADTVIYMYYNNSAVGSQQNGPDVWDGNYKGVWHLDEVVTDEAAPGGTHADSTGSFPGTQYGNDDVSQNIVRAQDFDNQQTSAFDRISLGSGSTIIDPNQAFTISAWVYVDTTPSVGEESTVYSRRRNTGDGGDDSNTFSFTVGTWDASDRKLKVAVCVSGTPCSGWSNRLSTSEVPLTAWSYIVATFDGGNTLSFYINGQSAGTPTYTKPGSASGLAQWIGTSNTARTQAYKFSFDGKIDEVRVSNTARTYDWIRTEYNNQKDPSTFYSVGPERTQSNVNDP